MSLTESIQTMGVLLVMSITGGALGAEPLAPLVLPVNQIGGEAPTFGSLGEFEIPQTSPGTLFRWSAYPQVAGGPQLDEPLETDRPDFTEASVTVGRGVAQVEFGYTYTSGGDGAGREQSYGEPLLRYGVLADWLEFRMAVFPVRSETGSGAAKTVESGFADLYLGFKIGLTPQADWLPEIALMPQMNVPSGKAALSSPSVSPGVCTIYGWELTDEWSMAGQSQWNRAFEDDDDSYLEFSQAWVFSRSLSDELGMYVEWFALWPSGASRVRAEHYIDGGFTYLISDDIQLDIRAGKGLTGASDDWFLGTGLSVRFR